MLRDVWRGAHWFAAVLHRVTTWVRLGLGLQVQTTFIS
jgi:hypothetical protein